MNYDQKLEIVTLGENVAKAALKGFSNIGNPKELSYNEKRKVIAIYLESDKTTREILTQKPQEASTSFLARKRMFERGVDNIVFEA